MKLVRRPPKPTYAVHDEARKDNDPVHDLCSQCGLPGSTCHDCGNVFCDACMKSRYLPGGHDPSDHLIEPESVPETEEQRLFRENRELEEQIHGTTLQQLQRKNAKLRRTLATMQKNAEAGNVDS